jgi:outer membrane protein TolC
MRPQAQLVQARVQWQNASLQLSNYLWDKQQPRGLPVDARPCPAPPAGSRCPPPHSLAALSELARQLHPDLQKSRAKLVWLGLERRLLANKLLPKLNFDHNVLQDGQPLNPETGAVFQETYLQNNYKLSLSFAYPLLLRQERAKLQLNHLQLHDTELGLQQHTRNIQTGVRAVANDQEALREQLALQIQVVLNAARRRDGEQSRFDNGESSVLLMNAREASLVMARVKLVELQAKYAQTQAALGRRRPRISCPTGKPGETNSLASAHYLTRYNQICRPSGLYLLGPFLPIGRALTYTARAQNTAACPA